MAKVKPFKGIRPPVHLVEKVASKPYDVLDSEEARIEAEGNPMSLYHIIKPEIDFPKGTDEHSREVYAQSVANFLLFQKNGWLVQDNQEQYYVYAQTMDERTQYGIVLCAHVDDYFNGVIKKHELTRKDKEDDRMIHVRIHEANIEPVFLAFPFHEELARIIMNVTQEDSIYDFVTADGFGHHFWGISDALLVKRITELFEAMPAMYIADGHHRSAAAARVGAEMAALNPNHSGNEEYNYFLAVCFPDNELKIMDYNRVVKDLNGLSIEQFSAALEQSFEIEKKGIEIYKPDRLHNFSLYVDGNWYSLTAKSDKYNDNDPIGTLDVTISSDLILQDILNIGDLRTSNRIDFVGGLRGLEELKRRVDSGEMAAALALYPVSMKQLMDIAETGNIMPPKTTWFEPKLRSGIVIHSLV